MLSTPLVDVMSVKVPEAVVLREELHAAAVVVVESSDFLQAPMTAIMPTIRAIQNSIFFIITSLSLSKNAGLFLHLCIGNGVNQHRITPHSHNTKQPKNTPGQFFHVGYSYYKHNTTLIFRILSFCFASVKSTLTTLFGI